jgi:tRNA (cmo5U34)-methyltransferase
MSTNEDKSAADKSTVDEIRARFDVDVERFSKLETGTTTQIDSVLCLDLIAAAATATTPQAKQLLDIGCGAGNWSLKLLERLPKLSVTLLDLSQPMLARAKERVSASTAGQVATIQGDIREIELPDDSFDLVVAGAVFHHLRSDSQWKAMCAKLFRMLRPGGSVWICDLLDHEIDSVRALMTGRYGDYLQERGGPAYRDHVFAYVAHEDSPIPVTRQCDYLREAGFAGVDILHKVGPFAAFGAQKR